MVPRIGFEPMYVRLEGVCRSPLGDRGIKLRVRIKSWLYRTLA